MRREVLGISLIVLVGTAARFYGLSAQSFWGDEVVTSDLLRMGPGAMLAEIPSSEGTPPLYYLLAWPWARVFGFGEAGLRSLSAVAGVLTVPAAYVALNQLGMRRAAWIGALFVALSPVLIWYGQEARSYSLFVLLAVLALVFFLRALGRDSAGDLAGWSLMSSAMLLTHYFAAAVILPMALVLVIYGVMRRAPAVLIGLGPIAVTSVALLPLLALQGSQGKQDWIERIPFSTRAEQVPEQWIVGFSRLEVWPIVAVLALGALVLALRSQTAGERRVASALAVVGAAAIVLPTLTAAAPVDTFLARNLIAAWPAVALVTALGLGTSRAGTAGLVGVGLVCLISVFSIVEVRSEPRLQRPDWKVAAQLAGQPTDDRYVVSCCDGTEVPVRFHFGGTPTDGDEGPPVTDLVFVRPRYEFDDPGSCWWGAVCQTAIPSPGVVPRPTGFDLVSEQAAGNLSVLTYRAASPRRPVQFLSSIEDLQGGALLQTR